MSIKKALLRIARSVVESVIGQITQQLNIVQNEVLDLIMRDLTPLRDGAWQGQGAERFFEEMESLVIPRINEAIGQTQEYNTKIRNAIDIMDRAEETVRGMIHNVVDSFDIF